MILKLKLKSKNEFCADVMSEPLFGLIIFYVIFIIIYELWTFSVKAVLSNDRSSSFLE